MITRRTALITAMALTAIVFAAAACADVPGLKRDLAYKQGDGWVDVMKGDKLVMRYVYKDTPKPYFYPVHAPSGEMVTRNFPMKTVAGEPTDHPHHRSFWLGFGDVNGIDFWAEGEKMGKIVQTSIDFNPNNPGYWAIHTTNDWLDAEGKRICEDDRRMTFLSCQYGTLVSTAVEIRATEGDLKFADNKEGFFAIRVAPGMQLKDGKGHILNSEGQKDAACWGKRARWCDYTGEVNGKTAGFTIFDSPINHGYPTYWHARDYGLFAANPFGGKAFTEDAKNDSTLTVPQGSSASFVYIVLIHDGKIEADTLNTIADQTVPRGPGEPEPFNKGGKVAQPKPGPIRTE